MTTDNGNTTETSFGIMVSKWNVKILISILGVIFTGFTFLYAQDNETRKDLEEELEKKAPISMLIKLEETNTSAHNKLKDQLEEIEKGQVQTNLGLKRIETILEERFH